MGRFIVIEGLDGSGKSSQIELLKQSLESRGEKVHITHEPTSYETGAYLNRILAESDDKDIHLQAALFLADRIEHVTNPEFGIKKYLDEGYTVICDRYYYSSLAYQGTDPECDYEWVRNMNLGCSKLLKPDLCIFLDVKPEVCKNRIDSGRDNIELYEQSAAQLSGIRDGFMTVLDDLKNNCGHNIVIIDGGRDIDVISKEILSYV